MSCYSYLQVIKRIAENTLKSFSFNYRSIHPSRDSSLANNEVLHLFLREVHDDEDVESYIGIDWKKEISSFFESLLRDKHHFSVILGGSIDLDNYKNCFESLQSLYTTNKQFIWTLKDYDELDAADYFDPALSWNLIVLDYCSSDTSIIKDCTHLLNRCWGNKTTIVYLSIFYDTRSPVSYFMNHGLNAYSQIDCIQNQLHSCMHLIDRCAREYPLKCEILNEKTYYNESLLLPIFIPVPHFYFIQADYSDQDIIRQIHNKTLCVDFDYKTPIKEYLISIKESYSSIHLFVECHRPENNEKAYFKDIIDYFKDAQGFTVDDSLALGEDYGAPRYYNEKDALFVVLNLFSTPSILHSQAIPLVNWLGSDDSLPATSENFQSLFISVLYDKGQSQLAQNDLSRSSKELINCVSEWPIGRGGIPFLSYYKYYPTRFTSISKDDEEHRRLIWSFKNNRGYIDKHYHESFEIVYSKVKKTLEETFGGLLNQITFFCIPTSTQKAYQDRFEVFSSRICKELGMDNAFYHIHYAQDGEAKHLGGRAEPLVEFDPSYFCGRFILMFDDIYTLGRTSSYRRNQLQELNATVIGLITIGKTILEIE